MLYLMTLLPLLRVTISGLAPSRPAIIIRAIERGEEVVKVRAAAAVLAVEAARRMGRMVGMTGIVGLGLGLGWS